MTPATPGKAPAARAPWLAAGTARALIPAYDHSESSSRQVVMTERYTGGQPAEGSSGPEGTVTAPVLDSSALAQLATFGEERATASGDLLFQAGDQDYDFIVVLSGAVEIVRPANDSETVIGTFGAGQFLGELNLLTGQRARADGSSDPAGQGDPDQELRIPATDELEAGPVGSDLPRLGQPTGVAACR